MKERTKEKLDEYGERHRFWADQAISQFGSTTNLFFIITAGFLAFLVGQDQMNIAFDFYPFHISTLFFSLSVIFALIAVFLSCFTVLCRLHDLRLTRHTIWIRRKSYKKWESTLPNDHVKLPEKGICIEFQNFLQTITSRKYFITDSDIENKDKLEKKFFKLRKRNLLLGRFSWRCLNWQIIAMLTSFLSFVTSFIL